MPQATLREAKNTVKIVGILKETNLEVKSGDKGKFIAGHIIVQTDPGTAHRVNVYATEKTKDGRDSGIFKGLNTVKETFISQADCAKAGRDLNDATVVYIGSGRLGLNEYYGEDGKLHSNWSVDTSFISESKEKVNYVPEASFDVEGFISSIREVNEKTLLDLVIPVYGGRVVPLTFTVDPSVVDFVQNTFSRGDCTEFTGKLVNVAERNVVKKQGFGGDIEEVTVKYVRELIIDNGNLEPYDPDDDSKAWQASAIKDAMAEREVYLESLKDKSSKKTVSKPAGAKAKDFDF